MIFIVFLSHSLMESYGLSVRKLPNFSKSTNKYVRKNFP